MITTGARAFLLAVVVCGGMLAACDDSPGQSATPTTTTKKSSAPKIAGLAPDMVAAVSSGKTATMLGMHFALRATPKVNEALPVDIAIIPHRDFTALQAHFESRDGLTLTAGDLLAQQGDAPAEKALTHQLVLLPDREGLFMLTAIVETEGADGTVSRVFSIPVIVAPSNPPASEPPAAADGTADGAAPAAK
jgi:hypothetical protein